MNNGEQEFKRIVKEKINRLGINDLMLWLDETDFYTAPASTRYHDCFEGGLVMHSLNVYYELKRLCKWYDVDVSEESIAIAALFHDICKVGCYKTEMRWRKDENDKWEQYPTYKFEEDYAFGGHGSKSVYLVQSFIPLEPDEATAINCHMGVENGKWEVLEAFRRCPFAFLLHVADMGSTIPEL
jgi:hypothetical protein